MANKYLISEENLKSMSLDELEQLEKLLSDDYKKALHGGSEKKLKKLELANIATVIAAIAGAATAVSHIFAPAEASLVLSSTGLAISIGSLAGSMILNKKTKNVIEETNYLNNALYMVHRQQKSAKHLQAYNEEQCNLDDDNDKSIWDNIVSLGVENGEQIFNQWRRLIISNIK